MEVVHRTIKKEFTFTKSQLLQYSKIYINNKINQHLPLATCVIDGTEIKINKSGNKDIEAEEYSQKKKIHSVNVLVIILLYGRCIYISDAKSVSHDQQQWNELKLREKFENIPVGIIGDKGFFFNPKNVLDTGRPFIIGYKPKKIRSEEDKLHNSSVAQLRVVVENFICQMKKFKCLLGVFPHYRSNNREHQKISLQRISKVVKIVAYLANLKKTPRSKTCGYQKLKKNIPHIAS